MWDKIAQTCRFLLQNYPGASLVQEYLDSRISRSSQELFQLGYFPPIDEIYLLTDFIGEEVLQELKLVFVRNIYDSLYPRTVKSGYFDNYPLIIPYKNAYGVTVGLVGRTLLPGSSNISKYKNTHFKKGNHLFGLYENKSSILKNNHVYLVEGQFDVIKALEKELSNIVAIGNNNITSYQFSVISRYTNNITLLLDNDEAGVKGRKNMVKKFDQFANITNFYVPEPYKDVDEYFSNETGDFSFVVKNI